MLLPYIIWVLNRPTFIETSFAKMKRGLFVFNNHSIQKTNAASLPLTEIMILYITYTLRSSSCVTIFHWQTMAAGIMPTGIRPALLPNSMFMALNNSNGCLWGHVHVRLLMLPLRLGRPLLILQGESQFQSSSVLIKTKITPYELIWPPVGQIIYFEMLLQFYTVNGKKKSNLLHQEQSKHCLFSETKI